MSDLISRSAALDILSNEFDMAAEERAEAHCQDKGRYCSRTGRHDERGYYQTGEGSRARSGRIKAAHNA